MCFVHSLRSSQEVTLNSKAKTKAKRASHATNARIITPGEIFADGAMIELVSGSSGLNKPELLLWNGSKATVGPRVEHGGCVYEAPELASESIPRNAACPSRCSDYSSARAPVCRNRRFVSAASIWICRNGNQVCSPAFPSAHGWLTACRPRQAWQFLDPIRN